MKKIDKFQFTEQPKTAEQYKKCGNVIVKGVGKSVTGHMPVEMR